jgi:hypothetical protein
VDVRVAVLSLTRDRLEYTQHCFASLAMHAGCPYDHYVLDQGSTDGTLDWLYEGYAPKAVLPLTTNVGIHRGWNMLLELAADTSPAYDAYVTFDNDCEVVQPGTLAAVAGCAVEHNWVLAPTILGLLQPPTPQGATQLGDEPVDVYPYPGGIFRALPQRLVDGFRFNEAMPPWGGDETWVGTQALLRGFGVGYLRRWHVYHYETTAGQRARYPAYFERKDAEWAAA